MAPNRVVALLTPLVFAPLAGAISALIAENFPGLDVPPSALEEVFIAGAVIAFAKSAQWTQGWQKFEAREAQRETETETLEARAAELAARESALAAREAELMSEEPELELEDELLAPDLDLDFDIDERDLAGASPER